MNYGPYPHVTLFESANRIMSDLTILYGIKELLSGAIEEINFEQYNVDLGHDFNKMYDIEAKNDKLKLFGEGFYVAESFFQIKKTRSLQKLRRQADDKTLLLLVYNHDAISEKYKPTKEKNVFHLKVKLDF